MDDELFEDLPLARKSVLPGAGFFTPDEEGLSERRIAALERADAVVIADGDADGLGCAALIREHRSDDLNVAVEPPEADGEETAVRDPTAPIDPEATVVYEGPVALVPTSPHRLAKSIEQVREHAPAGVDVDVCDLCPDGPDDVEPLADLVAHAGDVRWFDHHQWDDALARAVREAGVNLVVGESNEECSTDVALRSLEGSFADRYADLAAVTRDHDLWLREDPRSDDLADYAYWVGSETYVATVRANGADLPESAAAFLRQRRIEKQALIDRAVERAGLREVDGTTVAVTYGRCSQNEVAEPLRERGADAAVIVKPAGSASIRGTEGFKRCHEVAARVNGGGHPEAAGCKPDIYDDVLDYAHHWTTRGATAKQVILDAFRDLPPEEPAGDEAPDAAD